MDMRICHVLLLIRKNRIVFYSHGINHYEVNNNHDTIHAEVDCIMNLKINKKYKSKSVNLFVFRTNPKGNVLLMDKPCTCCMNYIEKNLNKKNYKLNKIYYTNSNGLIENI